MVTSIRLQHFRSYTDATFRLGESVNVVVGPNASGKTNLLEAILVIAQGASYRVKDSELIQFDAPWGRLDAEASEGKRTVKLTRMPPTKAFEVNEQTLVRLHQSRTLPVVLFEPDHLLLLSGSPDLRRAFLDDLIEQVEPGFSNVRRQYKRVLSQRNALLKKNPRDLSEQLFVWNLRLSELGGRIAHDRAQLVDKLADDTAKLYISLASDAKQLSLSYISRFPVEGYESALLRKLETSLDLDLARGFTAYGPHRDDLGVLLDGHASDEVASRGEVRTIVLTLKIGELHIIEQLRQQAPLLLLDDVFSELDIRRREALTKYVANYQTFITTTDADAVLQHFRKTNAIPLRLDVP